MNIACITFHNSSNYGAVLQTYALQQVVRSMGHNYTILDYSNSEKLKHDSLIGRNKELSTFHYMYKLVSIPFNYIKKAKFIAFSDNYLCLSAKKYLTHADLQADGDKYDRYICGSDQVWNGEMVRYDSAYYLSFVKERNKKLSYAASFGRVELTTKDYTFYREQLKNIDKISVREKSGQDIVKECIGRIPELVLDPTLLLTPDEWSKLIPSKQDSKKYILTYCLSNNREMQNFITRLSRQTGLKVIGIARGIIPMLKENAYTIASPQEFVSLFANASYVVTDSFHGTAFSTNFNKSFFSFVKGDKYSATNSRITDFLTATNLVERIYTDAPQGKINTMPVDFSNANNYLKKRRQQSLKYLKDSIEK